MAVRRITLFAAVLAAAAAAGSCSSNPVHDTLVNQLGAEAPGVPQGEYHRAGQPCAVCHGPDGPAKTEFTVAGTIFFGPLKNVGVDSTDVIMVDSVGTSFVAHTNCVGNFYVTKDQWDPAFPVRVEVSKQGFGTRAMVSHIGREASCSNCHKDPPYFDSPGHVHLTNSDDGYVPPPCPVSPVLSVPGSGIGP